MIVRLATVACAAGLAGCSLLFAIGDDAASGTHERSDGSPGDAEDEVAPPQDAAADADAADAHCDDPDWDAVVLLVSFDDEFDRHHFVDHSKRAHHITHDGDVIMIQARNSSAALFDGNGDYLSLAASPDWNFGADDFTIELWFMATSANPATLLDQWRDQGGDERAFTLSVNDSSNKLAFFAAGPNVTLTSATDIGAAVAWHHVAVVRSHDGASSTFALYIDGTQEATTTQSGALNVSAQPLLVGRYASMPGHDFMGYVDDIRITKGIARYTASFIPPETLPICP